VSLMDKMQLLGIFCLFQSIYFFYIALSTKWAVGEPQK